MQIPKINSQFVVTAVTTVAVVGLVAMALRWGGSQVGGTVGAVVKKAADVID